MNRNKEYRLKRKTQRKDYIIQDKNFTIKTLYYRNETKRNKIEQLQQENKQLKEQVQDLKADYGTIAQIERDLYKEVIDEVREVISGYIPNEHAMCKTLDKIEFILDKAKENK